MDENSLRNPDGSLNLSLVPRDKIIKLHEGEGSAREQSRYLRTKLRKAAYGHSDISRGLAMKLGRKHT